MWHYFSQELTKAVWNIDSTVHKNPWWVGLSSLGRFLFRLHFKKSLSHGIASADSASFLFFLIWKHIFICNERLGTTAAERYHIATIFLFLWHSLYFFFMFCEKRDKQITINESILGFGLCLLHYISFLWPATSIFITCLWFMWHFSF